MEQVDLVPFSSLISSMILIKRNITPMDIVNVMSKLGEYGIVIDDENDSVESISCCIRMNKDCSFSLLEDYNELLDGDVTVSDFLLAHSNKKIDLFLKKIMDGMVICNHNNNIIYNDKISENNKKNKFKIKKRIAM